jgi:hypothetical protein
MWAGFPLEAYKADFDKEDGFFIYMSTSAGEVPKDTDLTASVHAYDGNGVEKGRFWTTAVIESCEGPVTPDRCSDEEMVQNDNTPPRSMVLPGDGPQDYVRGIYIDFGEKLSEMTVYLSGDDITMQLRDINDDANALKPWMRTLNGMAAAHLVSAKC